MWTPVLIIALVLAQAGTSRFRSGVDVVQVDALVMDRGRPVTGLSAADFELRDNGVVQSIDSVTIDDVPVSMLLVLDTSNSVDGETLQGLKAGAVAAIDALGERDRVAIISFASTVRLLADWSAPTPQLRDAVHTVPTGGATALYDALFAALTFRDEQPGRRQFLVVFSDGSDSASWLPARAVLERARRTDATVFFVTRRPPRPDVRLEYRSGIELWPPAPASGSSHPAVVELADLTGGGTLLARRGEELREVFSVAVTQFRNRYLIRYRPGGVDTRGWHALKLRLLGRSGTVTARRGYLR
jgi:VWFA-related protein